MGGGDGGTEFEDRHPLGTDPGRCFLDPFLVGISVLLCGTVQLNTVIYRQNRPCERHIIGRGSAGDGRGSASRGFGGHRVGAVSPSVSPSEDEFLRGPRYSLKPALTYKSTPGASDRIH